MASSYLIKKNEFGLFTLDKRVKDVLFMDFKPVTY